MRLSATIHGGITLISDQTFQIPVESGACIHHLSHTSAAQWIEKTNRYTSIVDRYRDQDGSPDLVRYAHEQIDLWAGKSAAPDEPYIAAVAMLRAVYAIVDRIKAWEQSRGLDGEQLFSDTCSRLEAEYADRLGQFARPVSAPVSR